MQTASLCSVPELSPSADSERAQDYTYRPGRFVNNEWPDSPLLGVQYNICVDAFYPGNGATQFMPYAQPLPFIFSISAPNP